MRALTAALGAAAVVVLLAGCAPEPRTSPPPYSPPPSASPSAEPSPAVALVPAGEATELASGLDAPWSVVPIDGSALMSERDTARIVELTADGGVREAGIVAGVAPRGEGGLLGLALLDDDGDRWLYAYYTAEADNRIVRMPLRGDAGSFGFGDQEVVLDGLAKAGNHNGGRLAFGPDGMLYATVGDAAVREAAQDPASLNGKILRMTPEGGVPDGNPLGDSLVWSMGHRNPQGLAWASDGTMYAAEFGQDTWDELNRIEPGANYGWPAVEGIGGETGFVDPIQQWATSDASPSGLVSIGATLFLAGLGGERLWVIQGADSQSPTSEAFFDGAYGRIRDAVAAPDGALWLLTNNTDGRGDPREGDDGLLRVELAPAG